MGRTVLPTRLAVILTPIAPSACSAAFPFILDQDTSNLPAEFALTPEWKSKLVALKNLEAAVKHLTFPKADHTADRGK